MDGGAFEQVFVVLAQAVVGGTLVYAAAAKLLDSVALAGSLRLSHVPEDLVQPLARVIPVAEFGVGWSVLALAGELLVAALAAAVVLLAVFSAWLISVIRRRLSIRCSCFGVAGGVVGWSGVLRNAVISAVAVLAAVLAATTDPLMDRSIWALALGTAVAMTISLAAALMMTGSVLIWRIDQVEGVRRYRRAPRGLPRA